MMRTTSRSKVASVLLIALLGIGCGTAHKAAQPPVSSVTTTTQGNSDKGAVTPPSQQTPGSNPAQGTTQPPATPTTPVQPSSPSGGATTPPAAQWELISKWSDVQGTIVSFKKANDGLQSVSILVTKDFKTPTSPVTTPDFPFRVGSTVDISFHDKLPSSGVISPKVGDEIILGVGQFANTKDDKQPLFWGSSLDRYWYERDHKFYNQKGDVYKIFTGPDMQQTQVYTL